MTKAEFLQSLREKLMGEVSSAEIENTVRYYEDYIEDAVKNGKQEKLVLEALGDPLLIARTIIDTAAQTPHDKDSVFQQAAEGRNRSDQGTCRKYNLSPAKVKIVLAIVLFLVLMLVFTILRVLIPLVLPVLVIFLVIRYFRGGSHR